MAHYTFGHTSRGFSLIEFEDSNKQECSIQKSSIAMEDLVWIGAGSIRMHIKQDQAKAIAEILLYFAEMGELPESMEALQS